MVAAIVRSTYISLFSFTAALRELCCSMKLALIRAMAPLNSEAQMDDQELSHPPWVETRVEGIST